jgi:uncharacterized protein (DUF1697 family)
MALVVLLRGMNVGGHRRFRPSALAGELAHLGALNLGAAGTLVIRARITRAHLRAELAARLPFPCEIVLCTDREIAALISSKPFPDRAMDADVVRFVSVLSRQPRAIPALPMRLPAQGQWLVTILGCQRRFVVGLHRRHMRVIGHLGAIDRLFGATATTRSWSTFQAIAEHLGAEDRLR